MPSTEPRRQSALFRQMAPKLRRRRPFLRLPAPFNLELVVCRLGAARRQPCHAWEPVPRRVASVDRPPLTPPSRHVALQHRPSPPIAGKARKTPQKQRSSLLKPPRLHSPLPPSVP